MCLQAASRSWRAVSSLVPSKQTKMIQLGQTISKAGLEGSNGERPAHDRTQRSQRRERMTHNRLALSTAAASYEYDVCEASQALCSQLRAQASAQPPQLTAGHKGGRASPPASETQALHTHTRWQHSCVSLHLRLLL